MTWCLEFQGWGWLFLGIVRVRFLPQPTIIWRKQRTFVGNVPSRRLMEPENQHQIKWICNIVGLRLLGMEWTQDLTGSTPWPMWFELRNLPSLLPIEGSYNLINLTSLNDFWWFASPLEFKGVFWLDFFCSPHCQYQPRQGYEETWISTK